MSNDRPSRPGDDILRGAEQIGAYLGVPKSVVYRMAAKKQIPTGLLGPKTMIASKRRLAEALDRIASGEVK